MGNGLGVAVDPYFGEQERQIFNVLTSTTRVDFHANNMSAEAIETSTCSVEMMI